MTESHYSRTQTTQGSLARDKDTATAQGSGDSIAPNGGSDASRGSGN